MIQTLKNSQIEIKVSSLGAELKSLTKNGYEYLWNGDAKFWGRVSPVLFPIVGALKEQRYYYNESPYELGQHGFARDMNFELIVSDAANLSYRLRSGGETLKVYPFAFELVIYYNIDETTVTIGYEVINRDTKPIYFAIGAHPAFALEVNDKVGIDDYLLEFSELESIDRLFLDGPLIGTRKAPFLNGDTIELSESIFDQGALVFDSVSSDTVTLKCRKHSKEVEVRYPGFEYLAFWSPPKAPFVCIEPWRGIADSVEASGKIEEKRGIIKLAIGESFCTKFYITVR